MDFDCALKIINSKIFPFDKRMRESSLNLSDKICKARNDSSDMRNVTFLVCWDIFLIPRSFSLRNVLVGRSFLLLAGKVVD